MHRLLKTLVEAQPLQRGVEDGVHLVVLPHRLVRILDAAQQHHGLSGHPLLHDGANHGANQTQVHLSSRLLRRKPPHLCHALHGQVRAYQNHGANGGLLRSPFLVRRVPNHAPPRASFEVILELAKHFDSCHRVVGAVGEGVQDVVEGPRLRRHAAGSHVLEDLHGGPPVPAPRARFQQSVPVVGVERDAHVLQLARHLERA
mmetsp:Transcript_19069/g.36435  ORF Transcript_19069/g.36435 Transcript_19069/m.36435 type:complete len:202 (-) Transcript_19069:1258-1863(-)